MGGSGIVVNQLFIFPRDAMIQKTLSHLDCQEIRKQMV